MAGEPSIEFTGYAGEIKDFQDSSILNVSVHPGYTDKNTNQWVDKEPQFYGVRPLSNQAKDALNQVRQLKSQPNMSVKVLVNGSLSKRVSEKDGKRYENWDVAARTIAVLRETQGPAVWFPTVAAAVSARIPAAATGIPATATAVSAAYGPVEPTPGRIRKWADLTRPNTSRIWWTHATNTGASAAANHSIGAVSAGIIADSGHTSGRDCMRRRTSSWRVGVAIRDVMGGFTPIRVRP